ncbi:MAG TPA: hypothetical protein DCM71_26550 [Runella sp.]|nr:hypothetical protein [Runella sp.]
MATSASQQDIFTLKIPKELASNRLVQKLMYLIRFNELTKDNAMTEKQADSLSETIQEKWWQENKDWFLKDVKQ